MKRFTFSRHASVDLQTIWNYLASERGFEVADKMRQSLLDGVRQVAETPALAHRRPDLTSQNVRFFRVHSYVIVVHADLTPLHVVRILHTARDLSGLL